MIYIPDAKMSRDTSSTPEQLIEVTVDRGGGRSNTIHVPPHAAIGTVLLSLLGSAYDVIVSDVMYRGISIHQRYSLTNAIGTLGSNTVHLSMTTGSQYTDLRVRGYKLYTFAVARGHQSLVNILEVAYRIPPSASASKDDETMISMYIEYGMSKPSLPIEYYDVGLPRLLRNSELSASFVRTMESHLATLSTKYPHDHIWEALIHRLYGRVVDAYNV